MIYIDNKSTDPAFNHALEEYYLKETEESVFMIWQNEPTVLIGKHQNLDLEVDLDYARSHGVHVLRRLSGGGTVYCDRLNMQYTFITDYDDSEENLFVKFAEPVVSALKKLGLNARFTGRNDILIDDKKVSGNAQYKWKHRIIHHGTILFDGDIETLNGCIRVRDIKFVDKTVRSVVSRIGLIKNYVDMDVIQFLNYIADNIVDYHHITVKRAPTVEELERSKKYLVDFPELRDCGANERPKLYSAVKYPFGLIEYGLETDDDNRIKSIKIAGDFFSHRDIDEYVGLLIGKRIEEIKDTEDIGKYIIGMTNEVLIDDLKKMTEV